MNRCGARRGLVALGLAVAFAAGTVGTAAQFQPAEIGPTQTIDWQSGTDPQGRPAGERPPNIVVILADDLGWNDLSWLGGGVAGGTVPTPHIDSLARDGVHFANGYSANGTCAPSRAALMTGRYGTRFGFEFTPTPPGFATMVPRLSSTEGRLRQTSGNTEGASLPIDEKGVPPSEITLAELLKPAGYHTVHIGKWHLGVGDGMRAHEQGFDESLLMRSGLYLPEDDPNVVNSKQEFDGIDRFLWRFMRYEASFNDTPAFEPGGYLTDYYTDQAVQVIEANKDRPFLLYLAHWAVHTPLQALRADYEALSHIEEHRLRVYAAMVRSLDRSVGRVLEALRENGLEENTLVFFTSDNGAPAYIGLPRVNEPFRGWKISFFEGGIHVPFLLKWPARLSAGQVYEDPVHGFDIFATAAAAAGVDLPGDRTIDGVDLVPHVLGEVEGAPHDRLFWRTGDYQVVLADGWKLQISEPPGGVWLFNMKKDPTEQHNLADSEPERVAALKKLLAEHNEEQAPPIWPWATRSPVNIDKTLLDPDAPEDEHIYWYN
ncbi:MAG: sulfatase-like hydrolase/transferase [Acidobacteriota bacterium]|nr:sulfatase-like hydrolase/transferase [Acidobacteriota bacterium]